MAVWGSRSVGGYLEGEGGSKNDYDVVIELMAHGTVGGSWNG